MKYSDLLLFRRTQNSCFGIKSFFENIKAINKKEFQQKQLLLMFLQVFSQRIWDKLFVNFSVFLGDYYQVNIGVVPQASEWLET